MKCLPRYAFWTSISRGCSGWSPSCGSASGMRSPRMGAGRTSLWNGTMPKAAWCSSLDTVNLRSVCSTVAGGTRSASERWLALVTDSLEEGRPAMPLVIGEVHTALLMTSAAVSDEMATELLAGHRRVSTGTAAVRVLRAGVDRGLAGSGDVAGAAAGTGRGTGTRARGDRGGTVRRQRIPDGGV